MSAAREDLGPILDTLREVNVSLERRARRAAAANAVTWGLVASSVFAFYAWVALDPGSDLVRDLGDAGLRPWLWIAPVLLGYALTLATGARLGRIAPASPEAKRSRWIPVAILLTVVGVVLVNLLDLSERIIPAMWVAFLAAVHWRMGGARGEPLHRVAAWGSLALAPVLPFLPLAWSYVAASAWYLAALAGWGAWCYHRR